MAPGFHIDRVDVDDMALEDLGQVHAMETQSFAAPWTRSMLAAELCAPGANNIVLRQTKTPSQLVGFACFRVLVGEMHLLRLAVIPGKRRQGLGRKLLLFSLNRAQKLGAEAVFLEVRQSNVSARKFYARAGFHQIGLRKGYYPDSGEPAVVLTKILSRATKGH